MITCPISINFFKKIFSATISALQYSFLHYTFFYKNTIIFTEPQFIPLALFFFFRFEPNLFLKFSYFSRNDLLLTASEKFHTSKSCIGSKTKHIEQRKDIFAWKQENDAAELAEIIFCKKNALG